jgi:hypothetical protein
LWALVITAIQTAFLAWFGLGLEEDRRQRAAVGALKAVGGSVAHDYNDNKFLRPDIDQRWRDPNWLQSTPRWSSRWWISTFTNTDPPLGTVEIVHFEAERAMTDAQWDYFCRAFSSAHALTIECPVKDENLRFLRHMVRLETIEFDNPDERPIYTLGEGLGQLTALRDLKSLTLGRVGLSTAGKKALGRLENLEGLHIDGEPDDDTLAHLTRLKRLGGLFLTGPGVTDAGLVHLRKLPDLQALFLQDAAITDDGLRHLEGLGIMDLRLTGTKVSNRGMAHVARMLALTKLDLAETGITDAAIPDLVQLKNLRDLCLAGTGISDAGCKRLLDALPNLKHLVRPSFAGGSYGF